jgi:hypothetical protein
MTEDLGAEMEAAASAWNLVGDQVEAVREWAARVRAMEAQLGLGDEFSRALAVWIDEHNLSPDEALLVAQAAAWSRQWSLEVDR